MKITVNQIQEIVSNATNIPVSQIVSPTRKSEVVKARHLSMHFSRWNTNLSMLKIATLHGRGNHATVIHADNCVSYDIRKNQKFREMYEMIEYQIKSC